MQMTSADDKGRIEYPRGEIEILGPGEEPRRRARSPFGFEGAAAQRSYTFRTGASGFLGLVAAALVASALIVFFLGFFSVVVVVTVAVVAGFYLRNKIRQWLGR